MDRVKDSAAKTTPHRVQRFVKDEDGHIVVFTVIAMTMMLAVAGFGLDIIQFETTRTKLQQTADRATLAAASLTQAKNSNDVVTDYFAKAGLASTLKSVQSEESWNSSVVMTQAEVELTPTFMNLWNLENSLTLTAKAVSRAEQRINNIEIVLVLDVSGSMILPASKLSNLKTAATEFVDTVLDQDDQNRVSIAIVPYNGQVNLPQYLQGTFINRVDDHNVANVNCFDLPGSAYSSLGLAATTAMPVTAHADTYTSTDTSGYITPTSGNAVVDTRNRWCPPSSTNVIRAPTNDRTALKNHINALTAVGATSINAGMKWGMALLDPSSAPLIDLMVAEGQTPASFSNRPFSYGDNEAMKIVVLMTDGSHFEEDRMNDGFRAGTSNIWHNARDNRFSVLHDRRDTTNDYYYPHNNSWNRTPYVGSDSSSSVRQTWPQVWERVRVSYVAYQMWVRPLGGTFSSRWNMFRTKTPVSTMNAQLQQVCSAAHAQDVIVYGIAFEAPEAGRTAIANCASSPSHYFPAEGLEIRTAFRSIATNISQLKLTQ